MKDELNTANLLTASNTAEVLLGLAREGMEEPKDMGYTELNQPTYKKELVPMTHERPTPTLHLAVKPGRSCQT